MTNSYRRPLKLAYFSPLPPEPSGISDYSQELLPYLAPWAEVHLFIDDYTPADSPLKWTFPIWNYREYPWRRQVHQYDCAIYQVGNSRVHRYLYPYLTAFPGVMVLHDLVLHHLVAGMALETNRAGLYLREMGYAYGPPGVRIARAVLTGQQAPSFFDYPLCQRPLDASLGVLVHSHYMVEQVRALRADVPVRQVAMGIPLSPEHAPNALLRRQLGLPEGAFILASFGAVTEQKRIAVVLRALAQLLSQGTDALYVIVGNVAPGLDLDQHARNLGIGQSVRVTGHIPRETFDAYLGAVDVCVNLRYPTAGETSASALRSMAAGLPTVVSDVGANRELPDSCCIRLSVDEDEEALLVGSLQLLATRGEFRRQLGRNARRYIEQHHRLEQAAKEYIGFLEELVWTPRTFQADRAPKVEDFDKGYLRVIAERLNEVGLTYEDVLSLDGLGKALAALGLDPQGGGGGETLQ